MKAGSLSRFKQADDQLNIQLTVSQTRSILENKMHQATTNPALSAIDPGLKIRVITDFKCHFKNVMQTSGQSTAHKCSKIFVAYSFIDATWKCCSPTCEFPTLHCTKLTVLA